VVGAGADLEQASRPVVLAAGGLRVAVLGVTDHPADFAARPDRPGVAFADLARQVPDWLLQTVREADAEVMVVTPHWGPNMTTEPVRHVRRAANALVDAGATLVAGHSAHVAHGVAGPVLYDLGDFLDDYRVDPRLRNDLGLLFLVTLDGRGPIRLEALPLKLEFCHTRLATGEDAAWMRRRFRSACAALDTTVDEEAGRLLISWR
jgi:poly-gamma-glutamate synthesis protein (capsule biosynthesis protein)